MTASRDSTFFGEMLSLVCLVYLHGQSLSCSKLQQQFEYYERTGKHGELVEQLNSNF